MVIGVGDVGCRQASALAIEYPDIEVFQLSKNDEQVRLSEWWSHLGVDDDYTVLVFVLGLIDKTKVRKLTKWLIESLLTKDALIKFIPTTATLLDRDFSKPASKLMLEVMNMDRYLKCDPVYLELAKLEMAHLGNGETISRVLNEKIGQMIRKHLG
jgi:hypothetical protein